MASVETRTLPERTVTDRKTGEVCTAKAETRYVVRWRDASGGSRAKTFTKRREADTFCKKIERELHTGEYVDPRDAKITLRQYFTEAWHPSEPLTSRTRDLYRLTVDTLGDLADRPLDKITASDVKAWLSTIATDGRPSTDRKGRPTTKKAMATGTARMHLARLRVLLSAAVEDRKISKSPAAGKMPVRRRTKDDGAVRPEQIPSPDALAALLLAMEPRYRLAVLVAALCSLRSGEVRGLRVGDFDHLHRRLHVRGQMVRERLGDGSPEVRAELKTSGSERTISLAPEVADQIREHIETYVSDPGDPDAPIIESATSPGKPLDANTLGYFWRKARKAAKVSVKFHDMRHFAVSYQLHAGASLADVQRFAGHSKPSTTLDVYTHVMPGSGDRVAANMAAIAAAVSAAAVEPVAAITS